MLWLLQLGQVESIVFVSPLITVTVSKGFTGHMIIMGSCDYDTPLAL